MKTPVWNVIILTHGAGGPATMFSGGVLRPAVRREVGNPLPWDAVHSGSQGWNLYLRGEYGPAVSITAEGA